MPHCIEITSTRIRLCGMEDNRLKRIDSWPRSGDENPVESLLACPLPRNLGPVGVLLDHPDLMLHPLILPPAAPERLDRMIAFELRSLLADTHDESLATWMITNAGPIDERRVLTLIIKKRLLDGLRTALRSHGASLARLTTTPSALFMAWKLQKPLADRSLLLIDAGGERLHSCFIDRGHMLFLRSNHGGFAGVAEGIGELRHLDPDQSQQLLSSLGTDAPDDIKELINRGTINLATTIATNQRFAQAQMQLTQFPLDTVLINGGGGRIPGVIDLLRKRLGKPVLIHNPFIGLIPELPDDQIDAMSQLPSPLGPVIAGARCTEWPLDLLAPIRQARRNYWRTSGLLRIAACAACLLVGLALLNVIWVEGLQGSRSQSLGDGRHSGLVFEAEQLHDKLQASIAVQDEALGHLRWLDLERRSDRIAREFLAAIADIQDPTDCPISLNAYRVLRKGEQQVQVEISGVASSAGQRSSAQVLNTFESELARRYPWFDRIDHIPVERLGGARHSFAYRFHFRNDRQD